MLAFALKSGKELKEDSGESLRLVQKRDNCSIGREIRLH
jgi:hypothetical protein